MPLSSIFYLIDDDLLFSTLIWQPHAMILSTVFFNAPKRLTEYEVRCLYTYTESLNKQLGFVDGDVDLLWGLFELIRRVPRDQFRSFDLDGFMTAVNKR
jgi:hypothetical protein